ncbi:hypothetical protein [Bacillus sp. CGMCC 1.16541]|uniref:hypothetical protein n=1 Tax=Bacillus sp. CGMCC 1.16541 TaxID=2185143 RepID=UPI000D7342B6|nr:hypothetical protein [Bacillus sp. CGMCC 1.16541]
MIIEAIIALPHKIKIAGVDYTVGLKELIDLDGSTLGQVIYQKSDITIKQSMSDDKKAQTLIHEMLHAILYESGYKEHSEEMVDRLSITLHQVLRDNDFSWLHGKRK